MKLRGFRIKPGEIEDALRKFPEVDDAVVILDSQRNIPRLIGYVVSFGVAPEACDLRAHLKARLPEYMAPAAFAVLREWPLTSSGKIDRRASAPGMVQPAAIHQSPRTEMERNIADLWKEVMSLPQLGLTTISLTWAVIL